tara:strand:+ start:320 stop:1042 length:723 start_codon:yes stop_codon:yes gene_type:complete
MPVKRITAPNDTAGKNLLKNGNNYNTVHDATAATNAGNADTKFTLHAKSGSNFFIRRGILLYDFRESPATRGDLPRQIKIFRAQLIVNDVSELAPQSGGDKVRVAWVFNPNTFGDFHANDYNKARYDTATYTSAQQLNNGADGEFINLDNKKLLFQLEKAINNKTYLHLVIRNELDYQDTAATGNNRAWFDRPNADNNPLQLRIFYGIRSSRKHNRGGRRVSKSGFQGTNISSGTSSGFN